MGGTDVQSAAPVRVGPRAGVRGQPKSPGKAPPGAETSPGRLARASAKLEWKHARPANASPRHRPAPRKIPPLPEVRLLHSFPDANLPGKKVDCGRAFNRGCAADRCHPWGVVLTLNFYTLTMPTIFPLTRPRFRCITRAGRQLPKAREVLKIKGEEVYGRTAGHATAAASTEGLFASPGNRRQTLSRLQREP